MDILVAIDAFDDLLHKARLVPLTDQVRLKPDVLAHHVAQIHEHLLPDMRARAVAEGILERLGVLVRDAKPVPLTEQVRVNRDELYEVLDALRGALAG